LGRKRQQQQQQQGKVYSHFFYQSKEDQARSVDSSRGPS
jgi:hypothetical protein